MVKIITVINYAGEIDYGGKSDIFVCHYADFSKETRDKIWNRILSEEGCLCEDGTIGNLEEIESIEFYEATENYEYRNVKQILEKQQKLEKQQEIEKKELAELARLKTKYEGK